MPMSFPNISRSLFSATLGAGLLSLGLAAGCGDDDDSSPDARVLTDAPVGGTDANIPDDASVTDAAVTDAAVTDAMLGTPDATGPDAMIAAPDAMLPNGNSSAVWVGDVTTNGVTEIVLFDGTTANVVAIPGTTVIDDYHELAISPDGTRIALGLERDGGMPQLVVFNSDGSGVTTVLVDDQVASVDFKSIAWSPDGSQIAYTSDVELNSQDLVYAVPSDGSSAAVLLSQNPGNSGQDARDVGWFSNTQVVFRSDLVVNGADNHYISDITATPVVPSPLIPEAMITTTAETNGSAGFAGGKIYLKSSHLGAFALYRMDPDGANLELVPFFSLTNGGGAAQLGSFSVSPDGASIAFSADSPTVDLYQIYVAPVDGTATLQSNITTTPPAKGDTTGPNFFSPIVWSADQTMLAVGADWPVNVGDADNDFTGFIIPSSGAAGGIRIWNVAAIANNQDMAELVFSSDSMSLYGRGDLVDNNDTEVFRTTDLSTADQDTAATLVQDVPAGGDVFDLYTLP